MATVTKHVSIVPIAGLDYVAHIANNFGPSVTIEFMESFGKIIPSRDGNDCRIIICLQADSANQAALNAAASTGLAAWGVVELTAEADPNDVSGLITVSGKLQPALVGQYDASDALDYDYSAPLVDNVTGKLKRDITAT